MDSFKKKIFKQVLTLAYWEREKNDISNQWQANVMRQIKNMEAVSSKINVYSIDSYNLLDRFLWRFAACTCAAALILFAYTSFKIDFNSGYQLTQLFISDPVNLNVMNVFEIL